MPVQRWRSPAATRAKAATLAAVAVAASLEFFPAWFGLPVAVAVAALGFGTAALGASVTLDEGTLTLRSGIIARRFRLADVTAVLVDDAKVSIARARGGEVSMHAWRKSPLDRWLGVPAVAGDIGHAIASAVALARDAASEGSGGDPGECPREGSGKGSSKGSAEAAAPPGQTWSPARSRPALATALLACTGAVALAAALLVRVSWHNPVMTALGVILALALGVAGVFYLLSSLWVLLAARRLAHENR